MKPKIEDLIKFSRQAGKILMDNYLLKHDIEFKGKIDIVTEVDKESEDFLINAIQNSFPGHSIVTEEKGYLAGADENCWYVDPLDGTSNYAHGMPVFCVTMAYAHKGQIVLGVTYDPTRDQCFSAEMGSGAFLNQKKIQVSDTENLIGSMLVTGFPYELDNPLGDNMDNFASFVKEIHSIRRLGSAALDIAYVASGWLDGYWEIGIHPWDIAAGTLLVKEAGGLITDLDGKEEYFKHPYALVAANPKIHPKILAILDENRKKRSSVKV